MALLKRRKKKNVKSPPSSRNRLPKRSLAPTGNKEFDNLLGGGFAKNCISLVAGGAGTAKTIFSIQFLVNGVEKYGEPGLYLTFEENKEKFFSDMATLGFDLEKLEKNGKFIFLEYKPEQVKNLLERGGGIIEDIIKEGSVKRIVIDSITSFTLLYEDQLAKKEAALNLFELIEKWDCTALLTAQEHAEEDVITAALEFEVDGIILMYHVKRKGRRIRALEILKMRGKKIPEKTMRFDIARNGIKIHPNEIVDV